MVTRKYALVLILFISVGLFSRDRNFEKLYSVTNVTAIASASSHLIEPGKKKDFYDAKNLSDKKPSTSWCTRKNNGVGEYIFVPFWRMFGVSYIDLPKFHKVELNITNGYGGNADLYYKNSRAKRILVEISELAMTDTVDEDERTIPNYPVIIRNGPFFNSKHEIALKDTPERQEIPITIELHMPKGQEFADPDLFFKVTILEVYPGSQYRDLCIADMVFYGESPKKKL